MHRYTVLCDFLGYFCNYAPGTGLPTESFSWKSTHQNLRLQVSPLQSSHVRSGADDGSGAHACVQASGCGCEPDNPNFWRNPSHWSEIKTASPWQPWVSCLGALRLRLCVRLVLHLCKWINFQGAHKLHACCHGRSRAKTNASFPALTQHDRASVLWVRPHPPLPPILSDLQHACKQRMRKCTLKVKGCPSFMQAS